MAEIMEKAAKIPLSVIISCNETSCKKQTDGIHRPVLGFVSGRNISLLREKFPYNLSCSK